jgi:DNA polymerase III delta prime subunit
MQTIDEMPMHTIRLIQGPPGTGKTHTISNLLAMFFARGAKRVHVCTPSNTAADEVMLRLSKPGGLVGIKDSDRDKMLLRIGATDYEALFPEI